METYSLLREVADSWALLAMFGFFIGAGIWAFLPSQSSARSEASMIPLRDDLPLQACCGGCDNCIHHIEGQADV